VETIIVLVQKIKHCSSQDLKSGECEGYVIRIADQFNLSDFNKKVAKFARKNHVQTDQHWMHGQEIIKNILKTNS
jgi:hypothetical protein